MGNILVIQDCLFKSTLESRVSLYYLLFVLLCVLRIGLGFLPAWGVQLLVCTGSSVVRLRAPIYGQIEMWVALHLQLKLYPLLPALREIDLSPSLLWPSFKAAVDLGCIVSLGVVQYCQGCLLRYSQGYRN